MRSCKRTIAVLAMLALLGVLGLGLASGAVAGGAGTPVTSASGVWSPSWGALGVVLAPTVTGFSPSSGPVTTSVTVTGTGFAVATGVAFNGTPAFVTSVASDTQLTATVPAGASSGPISVTNAGGTGASAASFTVTVVAAPTITSVSPASGAVGASVTIGGTGFIGVTAVAFHGTGATFSVDNASQITATVPAGATTGTITVTGPGGVATSPSSFTVTVPLPAVTSFTPTTGPVGTVVTLTGTGFSGATAVTFSSTAATTFNVVSATQITAAVPTGATSGAISVTTPGGTGASSTSFTVTAPVPLITSFTPASGPAGTVVTITGSGLAGATAVTFHGTAATTFSAVSATQVTATVPVGATTGAIAVTAPGGIATSATNYTVTLVPGPTISGFTPLTGPVGTVVTITGTGFSGATVVDFVHASATFTVNSATQITATVPLGAITGAIAVTTPGGSATSAASFTVTGPSITSFTPATGPAGTVVTLTGTGFLGATAVAFHGTAATTYTVVSATQITATVPTAATTGTISVTTPGGSATSSTSFTVTSAAPVITSIDPATTAAYGSIAVRLYVAGTGFESGAAQVFWNGSLLLSPADPPAGPAPNPTAQLYVTLPTTVLSTPTVGTITVKNPATGLVSNGLQFSVTGPTIATIAPATGANTNASLIFDLTGASLNLAQNPAVSLRGTGANAATTITASGVSLLPGSTTHISGTVNLASVGTAAAPAPAGSYDVVLSYTQDGAKSITLAGAFTVTGASLTAIAPATATNGNAAFAFTLTGTGLNGLTTPFVTLKGPGVTGTTVVTAAGVVATAAGTSMTGIFNLTAPVVAPAGLYDVILTYAGTSTLKLTQAFTVTNAGLSVTSISPNTAWVGSVKPLQTLTVSGSGFVLAPALPGAVGSQVKIGARVTTNTTFVSATQLTVPLLPADIAAAGMVPIAVINPDPGGGISAAVNLTVAAETSLPVSTITGVDTKWHKTPVVLTVSATDSQSGVQSTQWGIGTVPPWTTLVGSTVTVPAPADHSGDGIKIVSVQSTDWCNKVEIPAVTATVKIDTQGPTTAAMVASSVKKGNKLQLGYRADDELSSTCAIVLKIKKSSNGSVVKSWSLGQKTSSVRGNFTFTCNLAKAKYKYYVYATDLAGNTQTSVGIKTFTVK